MQHGKNTQELRIYFCNCRLPTTCSTKFTVALDKLNPLPLALHRTDTRTFISVVGVLSHTYPLALHRTDERTFIFVLVLSHTCAAVRCLPRLSWDVFRAGDDVCCNNHSNVKMHAVANKLPSICRLHCRQRWQPGRRKIPSMG